MVSLMVQLMAGTMVSQLVASMDAMKVDKMAVLMVDVMDL